MSTQETALSSSGNNNNNEYDADSLEFLKETEYIDSDNPVVVQLAQTLTSHLHSDREKACALFGYVRDVVKFGWTTSFSYMKASDVILSGYGYSVSKSTLFVALLRCVRIPAKQIFVDISSEILHGLGFPAKEFIDHSFVEVCIDGNWLKTDAFTLDRDYFVHAKERLQSENMKIGYGVHGHGSIEWDGTVDTFCQYLVDDSFFMNLTSSYFGYKKDVGEFYSTEPRAHNNFDINFLLTPIYYISFYVPNARVELLRLDKNASFDSYW